MPPNKRTSVAYGPRKIPQRHGIGGEDDEMAVRPISLKKSGAYSRVLLLLQVGFS